MKHQVSKIGVIGLGYVGLPLAVAFSEKYSVIGFDIDSHRIEQLNHGVDVTNEVQSKELESSSTLRFCDEIDALRGCNIFIVTVPTPINQHKQPDLLPLISASRLVGTILKDGDIVIFESTVYPGATEEICVPELQSVSGMELNLDFFVGYSPERINPGDRTRGVKDIVKLTSGSNDYAADVVDSIYSSIISAGTHKTRSIKVAEAAKVIENTQRDVNIALINELAIIFEKLGVDTMDVLDAAETKWNFMRLNPGLVGGHCIGVDPYYLTHKAQSVDYYPEMILAGRRLNDRMGEYVATRFVRTMVQKGLKISQCKVLVLGFTFKENCPDIRNTKVIDVVTELKKYNLEVHVYDPCCDNTSVQEEYGISLVSKLEENLYSGVILAVPHNEFGAMGVNKIRNLCIPDAVFFGLKSAFDITESDLRL